MGAEGGINWIKCTDTKKVLKLIDFLRLGWEKDSRYDEANDEALDNAYDIGFLDETYIVSTWNSCHRFAYGMEFLKDFIEYLKEQREDTKDYYWEGINPLQLTWIELVQDYLTRPFIEPDRYQQFYGIRYDYSVPPLIKYLHYELGMFFDKVTGEFKRAPYLDDDTWKILTSPVGAWLDEIEPLVDLKSVGSEETWT